MKKSLFITGASGFLGAHLLQKIDPDEFGPVYCLYRSEKSMIKTLSQRGDHLRFIRADLFDVDAYRTYLQQADIVIHLAALTGKASREDYFRTNAAATRVLLDEMAGQKKCLIYLSSVAVKFQNITSYWYAQSKIAAEQSVRDACFPYAILRPTMIIGKKSAVLNSFLKLAGAPIVPIFGDGLTKIQPVFVDDVVSAILHIAGQAKFENKTLDIGGPERVTIEDFINQIHWLSYEKTIRRVKLPITPITSVLRLLENRLLPLLPFTAGQMASFANDGVAEHTDYWQREGIELTSISPMLRQSLDKREEADGCVNALNKECAVLTRYLIGRSPDDYIQNKYLQGNLKRGFVHRPEPFDGLLVKAAGINSFFVKLVDVYSRIFYPNALIRKKIILLLAILESYGATYPIMDPLSETSTLSVIMGMAKRAALFLALVPLSFIFFYPLQAVLRFRLPLKTN